MTIATLAPCARVELAFAGAEPAARAALAAALRIADGATLRETRGAWRDDDGNVVTESAFELVADIPADDAADGRVAAYGSALALASRVAGAVLAATDETAVWARVIGTDGRATCGELRRETCDTHGADYMAHHADGSATCGRCYMIRARELGVIR